MTLFHIHKWNPPVDRQQACQKCGLVRVVECAHEWEEKGTYTGEYKFPANTQAYGVFLRCAKCGEQKKEALL